MRAWAYEPTPAPVAQPAPTRPLRVGLALGGGAARGFAHVGVIQVLERNGIRPSYAQKHFPPANRRGRLVRTASRRGEDGSVSMNADASIWAGLLDGSETATQVLNPERLAYVHVAQGAVQVNGIALSDGDGALLDGENTLTLHDGHHAEVLVFDLARR